MVDRPETTLADVIQIEEDGLEVAYVPHKNGLVRADKKVVVTFQITARERYLWSLEATRRGRTMTDIVRAAFNALLEEGRGED